MKGLQTGSPQSSDPLFLRQVIVGRIPVVTGAGPTSALHPVDGAPDISGLGACAEREAFGARSLKNTHMVRSPGAEPGIGLARGQHITRHNHRAADLQQPRRVRATRLQQLSTIAHRSQGKPACLPRFE